MDKALRLTARLRIKIRILAWNLNGVRTHEVELFNLLASLKPDIVKLCETRADMRPTFRRIWPGEEIEQILAVAKNSSLTRAGTAVIVEPMGEASLEKRKPIQSNSNNEMIQTVKVRLEKDTSTADMYAGPRTSGMKVEETLNSIYVDDEGMVILAGDLNARHKE